MKIGELANGANPTTKTIRLYEAEGPIAEPPSHSLWMPSIRLGRRGRLQFIRKANRCCVE